MSKNIIKMTHKDMNSVLSIIEETKQVFKNEGIDQWQKGYPNDQTLLSDIEASQAFVLIDNDIIVGYFALESRPDPHYKIIAGKWLSERPYVSVHRFVIATEQRGKGYAKWALTALESLVLEMGFDAIRVDTHEDNIGMLHLIDIHGYHFCGIVTVADGVRRAFEKDLR